MLLPGVPLAGILGGRLPWPAPRAAPSIRPGIAPILLRGPGLSRADAVGPALFADNAEPAATVGFGDSRGDFRRIHSTAGQMRQELTFFFRETSHHARFEAAEEEANLASKSSTFAPGARRLACNDDSGAGRHHLNRVEAWRVSTVTPLTGPLVTPCPLA